MYGSTTHMLLLLTVRLPESKEEGDPTAPSIGHPKNRDRPHNPCICLSLRAPEGPALSVAEGCVAISMYKGEIASLRSQ